MLSKTKPQENKKKIVTIDKIAIFLWLLRHLLQGQFPIFPCYGA